MEIKKYIKTILKPSVAKRAKAMKKAKSARATAVEKSQEQKLIAIETSLGYKFNNRELLIESLTHPGSVGFEKKVKSNQRLEFLGDAILQAIITDTVFNKFNDVDEGKLTKIRIALTQGSFLTQLSRSLKIPEALILPKGAEFVRQKDSAAEDAFEAVIGAIYQDSDFKKVKRVLLSWYKKHFDELPDLVVAQNPKGSLQEISVKNGDVVTYHLLSQSGPDHQKEFEVAVHINGNFVAKAAASSKKHAQTNAARLALKAYSNEETFDTSCLNLDESIDDDKKVVKKSTKKQAGASVKEKK